MKKKNKHLMDEEVQKSIEHTLKLLSELQSSLERYQEKVRRILIDEME